MKKICATEDPIMRCAAKSKIRSDKAVDRTSKLYADCSGAIAIYDTTNRVF